MAEKKLVVVLESTMALRPYWDQILSTCLNKLIRSFVGDQEANPNVQLALVQFFDHGYRSLTFPLKERGEWVRNVDQFIGMLEKINPSGGSYSEAAIAEGLAEMLMMCGQKGRSDGLQSHCILVSHSDPYRQPTAVYRPINDKLYDAVTLAKSFPEALVSLSVICPRLLPVMKTIYNVAKRNPSAADHTIKIARSPNFIVLIADDFVTASADTSQLGLTTLPSNHMDAASSSHSKPGRSTRVTTSGVYSNAILQLSNRMPTPTALLTSQSEYPKVWEGPIYGVGKNKTIPITGLRAHRKLSSPESIADDWPTEMHIYQCMRKDSLKKDKFAGKEVDCLAFLPTCSNPLIEKMRESNAYAVIKLPSHTLVLEVSDWTITWAGKLYPKDLVPGPQKSEQQPQPSQPQPEAMIDG